MKPFSHYRGFTLIELIAVIIILGVVGTAVISFIGFSAQLFVDVNGRDKVLADSRFVLERLNRELRDAVPNSMRVGGNSTIHCLEFMPVNWSTFYLDVPVAPEPASSQIQVIELQTGIDDYVSNPADFVIVFPISPADVYGDNGRRFGLSNLPQVNGSSVNTISLDNNAVFTADSPSSRLYVAGEPVSYCVSNTGNITRHTGYAISATQSVNVNVIGSGVLMGSNIVNSLSNNPQLLSANTDDPFRVFESSLRRNAFVHIVLRFARQDQPNEVIVFNNEVHIANVP